MANKFANAIKFNGVCREYGLTQNQLVCMFFLGKVPGIMVGRLTKQLDVFPAQMSRILRRLEKKEIIRTKADPDDARKVNVWLTAEGSELLNEIESKL